MRIKGFDFLRGVAIIVVLFRHANHNNLLHYIGWAGVDLFFVLSGFLVSGLLFREYLATQKADIGRFLIRRGFKIYPSFYLLILCSITLKYLYHHNFYDWQLVVSEVFYLQSYFKGIWLHTWSLAVEEHFYFALAFFAWWSVRYNRIAKREWIISILITTLVFVFLFRLRIAYLNRNEPLFTFFETHLRIDGVLVGVLFSYMFYFTDLFKRLLRNKMFLLVMAEVLISPVFIFEGGSFFMNTIGLSVMNVGFGFLVLLALEKNHMSIALTNPVLKRIFSLICFIGIQSYSIYIWHLLVQRLIFELKFNHPLFEILYIITSIIIGVLLSHIIERPFLKIRDLWLGKMPLNTKTDQANAALNRSSCKHLYS